MIRRIYASNFRCLESVDIRLHDSFQILIGANASGKSALMDVVSFLADFASNGVMYAIDSRTEDFRDLVWSSKRDGQPRLLLGIELDVDKLLPRDLDGPQGGSLGYEVELTWDQRNGVQVTTEKAELRRPELPRVTFSRTTDGIKYEIGGGLSGHRAVIDYEHDESMFDEINAELSYGPARDKPLAKAFNELKRLLQMRVNYVCLESKHMRRPTSRTLKSTEQLLQDGSNLPWLVYQLHRNHHESFVDWVNHLQTVLPHIDTVRVCQREWDRDGYVEIAHKNGADIPSWLLSEGTLRLMALTLLSYLPTDTPHIFMIEEPENGLHPYAIDAVFDSLSSVYNSHVLVSTHSPLFLKNAEPQQAVCFSRSNGDATRIKLGIEYEKSENWRNAVHNHLLFSSF